MSEIFSEPQARIIKDISMIQLGSLERVFIQASERQNLDINKALLIKLKTTLPKWLNEVGESTLDFQKLLDDPDYILEMDYHDIKQIMVVFNELKKHHFDSTPIAYNNLTKKLDKLLKSKQNEKELARRPH